MHTSIPRQYLATTLGLVVVLVLLSGVPGGTAPASAVWFALIPLAFLAAVHVLLGLRALAEAAAAARLGFHVRSVQAGLLRVERGGRVRVTARDDGPGVLPGDTAGLRRRAALVLGSGCWPRSRSRAPPCWPRSPPPVDRRPPEHRPRPC